MNPARYLKLTSAALLIIALGCSETTTGAVQGTTASMRTVTSLRPEGVTPPDFTSMSAEEREAYLRFPSEAGDEIRDAVLLDSWADANRKTREVLASNPDVPAYFLEAVAGTIMLERAVGAGQTNETPAADLMFYAGLLARNITPEADLTARALDAALAKDAGLRGEVEAIALRAVASGETFSARPENAQTGPGLVQETARRGTPPATDERRGAAMRHLRDLANS